MRVKVLLNGKEFLSGENKAPVEEPKETELKVRVVITNPDGSTREYGNSDIETEPPVETKKKEEYMRQDPNDPDLIIIDDDFYESERHFLFDQTTWDKTKYYYVNGAMYYWSETDKMWTVAVREDEDDDGIEADIPLYTIDLNSSYWDVWDKEGDYQVCDQKYRWDHDSEEWIVYDDPTEQYPENLTEAWDVQCKYNINGYVYECIDKRNGVWVLIAGEKPGPIYLKPAPVVSVQSNFIPATPSKPNTDKTNTQRKRGADGKYQKGNNNKKG